MPWPFMRGALSPSSRTASGCSGKTTQHHGENVGFDGLGAIRPDDVLTFYSRSGGRVGDNDDPGMLYPFERIVGVKYRVCSRAGLYTLGALRTYAALEASGGLRADLIFGQAEAGLDEKPLARGGTMFRHRGAWKSTEFRA